MPQHCCTNASELKHQEIRLMHMHTISWWDHVHTFKSDEKDGCTFSPLCMRTVLVTNLHYAFVPWRFVCMDKPTHRHQQTKSQAPSFTVTMNTQRNKDINTQWINAVHLVTAEPLLAADYYIYMDVCVAVASVNGGQVWSLSPFVSSSTNLCHSSWATSHSHFTLLRRGTVSLTDQLRPK